MGAKIAIFVTASIHNRKGLFNAFHNRVKHLCAISEYEIDPFIISSYVPPILNKLVGGGDELERPNSIIIDGVYYRIIWFRRSIIDYILVHYFNQRAIFERFSVWRFSSVFKHYDLIEAHTGAGIAQQICRRYGVPYVLTWHGSDIHTEPFKSASIMKYTRFLIEHAKHNFFVSKALLDTSDRFAPKGQKSVIYNGRDERFIEYSITRKRELREMWGVANKKVVSFVGNMIEVKNIRIIPDILNSIIKLYPNSEFWMIGDGPLRYVLESASSYLPIKMWGNQPIEVMPDLMNSSDVLILPSKQEGLPLVTIEALCCGCAVVGSRVGGIPESVGLDSTIPLDSPTFVESFSQKVVDYLNGVCPKQKISDVFQWDSIAVMENEVLKSLLINQ